MASALMLRGEVDFSLTLESFLTDQMDSRVILDENVLIAFPPDHPLGQKARQAEQAGEGYLPFHFPDAANESFLLLKRGLKFHDYFEVLSRKYGITPRVLLQTESITTILELVSKGVACGLVPDSLVAYVKPQPRPAFYSLQHEFAPNRVVAAWNRDLYLSNAARVFIDMLCERHKNERLASG